MSNLSLKPLTTEKAIMMIELKNTISFITKKEARKDEIKKEIESLFNVKVEKIRGIIRDNRKIVYVRLKKDSLAIDLATKLGMI